MRLATMLLVACFAAMAPTSAHAEGASTAVSFCSARGFAGSTVENAIAACKSAGFNAFICGRGVTCSPGMQLCTAGGFAGTTIESAIHACRQAGFQAYVCGRDVACH